LIATKDRRCLIDRGKRPSLSHWSGQKTVVVSLIASRVVVGTCTRVPVQHPDTRVFISTRILYVKKYKNVYIVYYLRLPSHKYGAQISGGSRNIRAIGNIIFR